VDRYDITILAPGMPFEGDTLERASLGGSETAALCMARSLQRLGHYVVVFSNTERPAVYDDVAYFPAARFHEYACNVPHDICIVQRTPEALTRRINSRLTLLWCHDLALLRASQVFRGVMWGIDKVMVLSEYMAGQYEEVYGLPREALWVTRNGVELDRFRHAKPPPRDRRRLMYCARPERGLDVLLQAILPKLLVEDSGIRLSLAGYNNPVAHMAEFYNEIDRMIASYGDRVQWLGNLTKDQLYRHYQSAGVYVYPTPSPTAPMFSEISCISAMECMAAGLPIVTSRRGALPETIGEEAGTLIDGDPTSSEYQDAFVQAVMRYVRDGQAWERASSAGRARSAGMDWYGIAQEWTEQFAALLAERNDDPYRLTRHLIRHSDIIAAKELVAALPPDDSQAVELRDHLERDWSFSSGQDAVRQQYERIGQTHTDVFDHVPSEPRFQLLHQWLVQHPDAQKILDFGCAHGAYAVNMANRVGRRWVGVDIDRHSIEWANKYRETRAVDSSLLQFVVGDESADLSDHAPFDLLWIGETLEHFLDPAGAVSRLERWVRHGGKVLMTTPYGPWEYLSYDTYPHRAHLWEYDRHDLRDMFGGKRDVMITAVPHAGVTTLGEPLGWYVVEYTVDAARPTGRIDMSRKLRLQRPRQTVSANIMAGSGAEETMHWCLRSIRHLADEVVLVDTGMNAEGRRIAAQYEPWLRVVRGSSPIADGFETPRNEGLAHCRMDWVHWIDTDETLVDQQHVHKYLRENIFHGYGIRQHHFACDTTFQPDMPVRLFRRRPLGGKSMRWYGMIHEHPELALNEGPGHTVILSDVHIAHVGYLIESTRRQRFDRNYPLLQRDIVKYPERVLQKHFMCRDNMLLVMYEMQQNGGRVTPEVRRRCEETIDLYRRYFMGKPAYLGTDTLQYYSQACKLLGVGFEATLHVAAGKDGVAIDGTNGAPRVYRFASREDFERELLHRAGEAAAPFASAWW
jgi:glycosyltransferase involved in cell wall biosynthesis/SAM-dependent methyltransferase